MYVLSQSNIYENVSVVMLLLSIKIFSTLPQLYTRLIQCSA